MGIRPLPDLHPDTGDDDDMERPEYHDLYHGLGDDPLAEHIGTGKYLDERAVPDLNGDDITPRVDGALDFGGAYGVNVSLNDGTLVIDVGGAKHDGPIRVVYDEHTSINAWLTKHGRFVSVHGAAGVHADG
ncbi:MAG: hypothetical protein AAGA99_27245 [Actinomycetota bacterium]